MTGTRTKVPGNGTRRRPRTAAEAMPERGRGGVEAHVRDVLRSLNPPKGSGLPPRIVGYHTWNSIHSPEGFPDWVLAQCDPATGEPTQMMAAELKRDGKDPTRAQQFWLAAFTAAGIRAVVWRATDVTSGLISRELTAFAMLPVHVPPAEVRQLAGILLRAAPPGTLTAAVAENQARSALRSGYQPPPSAPPAKGTP